MSSRKVENTSVQETNELHSILSGLLTVLTTFHFVIQFSAVSVLCLP